MYSVAVQSVGKLTPWAKC